MISTAKFNTLTELVSTLAKTGSDIGAQVFTLMRHIKHIENAPWIFSLVDLRSAFS